MDSGCSWCSPSIGLQPGSAAVSERNASCVENWVAYFTFWLMEICWHHWIIFFPDCHFDSSRVFAVCLWCFWSFGEFEVGLEMKDCCGRRSAEDAILSPRAGSTLVRRVRILDWCWNQGWHRSRCRSQLQDLALSRFCSESCISLLWFSIIQKCHWREFLGAWDAFVYLFLEICTMMVGNEAQMVVLVLSLTETCTQYSHFGAKEASGPILASFLNLDRPLSRIWRSWWCNQDRNSCISVWMVHNCNFGHLQVNAIHRRPEKVHVLWWRDI